MNFPAEDDFRRLLDALTLCVLLHDAQDQGDRLGQSRGV